jgi:hypothetical protein
MAAVGGWLGLGFDLAGWAWLGVRAYLFENFVLLGLFGVLELFELFF